MRLLRRLEARDDPLSVLPPDLNASGYDFTVAGDKVIRYGLGAVRGVDPLRYARAAGGAGVIVTGLSAEIAQTLVTIGGDDTAFSISILL